LDNQDFVTKAILDMIAAGAASVLPLGVRPAVVSSLGVTAKPHPEKLLLIWDMSINLTKRVVKFEGLSDLTDMVGKDDYSISYDLTSGYFHVALHPNSRRFVGLKWKDMYYQYNCIPFELCTAPWVFSKVIRELVMYWRAIGINILPYLDHFLFLICGYGAGIWLGHIIEDYMRRAGPELDNMVNIVPFSATGNGLLGFGLLGNWGSDGCGDFV